MWKTFDFQQTKITTHMAKGKCDIGPRRTVHGRTNPIDNMSVRVYLVDTMSERGGAPCPGFPVT